MTSKVQWMSAFPSHWQRFPSKYLFPESKKRATVDAEQLSATQDYGVIPQKEFTQLAGRSVVQLNLHLDKRKHVEEGDFVISMRSFQGGLERAWSSGGIRSSYIVIKPSKKVDVGYFSRLFKSSDYIQALQATANFIRDGQDLNYQNFCLIDLALPPIKEQKQIAAFLDYETAKIDALIEKQQQLIALLGEKRQAVISHAVTKGLNPDAPMRDSGIEWLGEVPEHWDVSALRHFATFYTGSTPDRSSAAYWGGDIPWVKTGEVRYEKIFETEEKISQLGLDSSSCNIAPIGTLIMALYGQGVTRGRVALLGVPAAFNQACVAINPDSRLRSDFLQAFFLFAYPYIRVGNETTQMNMNVDFVKQIPIVAPTIDEQKAIVAEVDAALARFDGLNNSANEFIELLQERRTALISAAVTGKIDVRNWKPPSSDSKQQTKKEVA